MFKSNVMYNKTPRSDRKFNKTREWLYEEYVIKNRPRKEIAAECGLTLAGLKNTLDKYGISKPKLEIPISELEAYLEEGKSVDDICDIYHCNRSSVYRRMKENNLTIHYKPDFKQYDDTNDELICQLYLDGFSTPARFRRAAGSSRRNRPQAAPAPAPPQTQSADPPADGPGAES